MFEPKNQNEQVVFRFFEALSSNDLAQLQPFFTEDFAWKPMFTGTGVKEERGSAIIENFFLPVIKFFKQNSLQLIVDLVMSDGETVVCELTSQGELVDGRSYKNQYCWVITVREGKMIRVKEYMDSHYVVQLLYS
jgi:ketosteroid isomerase-like protein